MYRQPVMKGERARPAGPRYWEACGRALLAEAEACGLLDAAAYPRVERELRRRLNDLAAGREARP